jgi:hypothetical protein
MAYSSDIAKILTDQITRFVTLNRHQLAGHVANLDFWTAEVRHCLDVIDGYNHRFERMKAAQMNYTAEHGTVEYRLEDGWDPQYAMPAAPPRRIPGSELKDARRPLCDAVSRFLIRCFKEDLVDEVTVKETCRLLDIRIEAGDLRQRT